ncbi:MAG: protein kinase domain-containing protein [Solirubrobacterales bacterium]
MTADERISGPGPATLLDSRYRLIRRLGSGGMATVWLAEDEELGRRVAVKVPSDVLAGDEDFLKRFRREAQVAAGLSHPNLVPIYDFSNRDEERPFLVMHYVEGKTLEEQSGKGRRVDAERLARELLDALDHIHAAGIVHRDVKPSNVLITREGLARLTDFGIAQPEDATRITQTGQVIGSLEYMAPEVRAGNRATARSDLYSCGMVLGDHVGPRAPAPLRNLVESLTAEDPEARPRSAADALATLERTESPGERRDAPTAPTLTRPAAARRPSLTRPLAGLLALALIAGFLILVSRDDPLREPALDQPARTGPGDTQTETGAVAANPDPATGARLNQEGFGLIQQGRPEEAVPILQQAVAAFPEGTSDLNYAYALFNLGQALRLSGQPEEAIPILEQRAQIPNQRGAVLEELEKAREQAGDD